MITKLLQTSLLLLFLFIIAIKSHGDNEPSDVIKAIEVGGVIACGVASFIFSFVAIWSQ